jgi:hypothetical protein
MHQEYFLNFKPGLSTIQSPLENKLNSNVGKFNIWERNL